MRDAINPPRASAYELRVFDRSPGERKVYERGRGEFIGRVISQESVAEEGIKRSLTF